MLNAAPYRGERQRNVELHNLLNILRPAAQLAISAYYDTNVFDACAWPTVLTSEQLEIWTPAAFHNTQVHIALVEEWDEDYKRSKDFMNVAGVFAFRGTQPWSLSDWLIDFDHEKKPVEWWVDEGDNTMNAGSDMGKGTGTPRQPMAHGGFLDAFNSVSVRPWPNGLHPEFRADDRDKTLDAALKRQIKIYNDWTETDLDVSVLTRIICTGHSLGGALATLAAVWARKVLTSHLGNCPVPHVTCVTLGAPRVGDEKFAEMFNELAYRRGGSPRSSLDCTRIVHGKDPVPVVPPKQWGFMHVGRVMWFDKQMAANTRMYTVYNNNTDQRPLHKSFFVPDHFQWRYLVAMDLAFSTAYIGNARYSPGVMGQNMDRTLIFLDKTFGGVANIKRLSMLINAATRDTHRAICQISPWGGRLLSTYGGAMWRTVLIPGVVAVYFATMAIQLVDG